MIYTNKEKKELKFLNSLIRGTPIKIKPTSNGKVEITSPGMMKITTNIIGTANARNIIQGRRSMIAKQKRKMKMINYKGMRKNNNPCPFKRGMLK